MKKRRVVETNEGIQNPVTVQMFDLFARNMRDKGWNGVGEMIRAGAGRGDVLEIGPGPGYVGLELAKRQQARSLTGCEISPAMLRLAEQNAAAYGICAQYVQANAMQMPFADGSFDCVISNGSLHEWEDPSRVFEEIYRVLRPGGRYCITDLRRDVAPIKKAFVYAATRPRQMRPGLLSSLCAAYTAKEISTLLSGTALKEACVLEDFFGLRIQGVKK